jgi:ubiquinone/menaquinone biosynthesis C-methylase UbiE
VAPDGEMVAFRNDARLGEGVLYHTGCSKSDALETGVNYLLVWEAIRGAAHDGFKWYEVGEVFPAATDGKARSLTEFKSRFGGELHRYFKARKALPEPAPAVTVPSANRQAERRNVEQTIRSAYTEGALYAPARICLKPESGDDYTDRLLHDKLQTVREFSQGGCLVDLCCGTGSHLVDASSGARRAIGIDFSERYLVEGRREATDQSRDNLDFVRADARHLPLSTASVDLLYCFSALYTLPDASATVAEIGRVLAPGGTAVLEFGNRRSLNVFCLRYYTEWPPIFPIALSEMQRALQTAGLRIVRHRRFQVLPLWAGRPRWLAPLLHPLWKRVMKQRVRGRMLDEWVSSLPLLRAFAFRHLVACRRVA